jgi:hypothetical protein
MRFIKGDSLKQAVERFHAGARDRSGLELRRLLRRFLDVCNAVEYAHSRGVVHRDIKPGNVIVGKHGETLIVDWGLAKPMGYVEPDHDTGERTLMPSLASGSAETLPGQVLGTPSYMSPEQAAGDLGKLGPASDVYSLGATLYCLLSGRPPFEGEAGEVLRRVQRGAFAPPRQLDQSVDKALEAVCLKAMATKPEDRYASCRALAEDVERWMADEPTHAYRLPPLDRARRWVKRHRVTVTAAAAAVKAAAVCLAALAIIKSQDNIRLTALAGEKTALADRLAADNDRLELALETATRRLLMSQAVIDCVVERAEENGPPDRERHEVLRSHLLQLGREYYIDLNWEIAHDKKTDLMPAGSKAFLNFAQMRMARAVYRIDHSLDVHPNPHTIASISYDISRIRAAGILKGGREGSRSQVDRAMRSLRRAVRAGFHDAQKVRADPLFEPLREREDFQLLMMDLAFPASPFTHGD